MTVQAKNSQQFCHRGAQFELSCTNGQWMKVKPLKDWARVATYTYKINYYICLLEEGGVGVNGSDQDVQ